MTETDLSFRAVYHAPDVYERVLLPHWFDGLEDTDHVADLLHRLYGVPGRTGNLRILELGCGTGRVTDALAPYAAALHGVDSGAPMLDIFGARFPSATTQLADIATAVDALHANGEQFDVVGAFWSLSYPIGDCFEVLTADGIRPRPDLGAGVAEARSLVSKIVDLVADGGHLIASFFDSDSPEQRVVTQAWERIAPFPGTGRGFTRETLLASLRDAEDAGLGRLTHTRVGGLSVATSTQAAIDWFTIVHLKSMPALVNDPGVRAEINSFVRQHTADDRRVLLPTGMHLIDFWRTDRMSHLPNADNGMSGVDL